jgi:flagellar hook-basal body complex protein FliE
MEITAVNSLPAALASVTAPSATASGTAGDFGRALSGLIDNLSGTEQSTNQLVARAAAGDDVDIHDVMIATQAESLAFSVGLQVRNKLVEAYHEIFRMQV